MYKREKHLPYYIQIMIVNDIIIIINTHLNSDKEA